MFNVVLLSEKAGQPKAAEATRPALYASTSRHESKGGRHKNRQRCTFCLLFATVSPKKKETELYVNAEKEEKKKSKSSAAANLSASEKEKLAEPPIHQRRKN